MKIIRGIVGIVAMLLGVGILFELLPVPSTLVVGLVYLALGMEIITSSINSIDN